MRHALCNGPGRRCGAGSIRMSDDEIRELINRRRGQVLVHSIIYYRMDESLISDYQWSMWATELSNLQREYPRIAETCIYADAFKDFDPSTGYNLPLGDPKMNALAKRLLNYYREHHR